MARYATAEKLFDCSCGISVTLRECRHEQSSYEHDELQSIDDAGNEIHDIWPARDEDRWYCPQCDVMVFYMQIIEDD